MKRKLPDHYAGKIDPKEESHFEFMYNKFYSSFILYAANVLKSNSDCEDVVVDVFVKFNKCERIFKSVDDAQRFMFASVRNKCFDVSEKNKHRCIGERAYGYRLYTNKSDSIKTNYNSLTLRDVIVELAKNRLPELSNKIFRCRFLEELSIDDTSKKTGYTNQTVKNQLHLAMKKLKEVCQGDADLMNMYEQYFHT